MRQGQASTALLLVLLPFVVLLAGCTADASTEPSADTSADAPAGRDTSGVHLPRADAAFDYQLGGPYPPPAGVRALSRDRTAEPAPGLYNICYVNAFQTQPGGAVKWWKQIHPELLLRDEGGRLVVDEDWQEPLLDISISGKREALLEIVGPWIDGCAKAGFDAVEPDNLDSYERSQGLLTAEDAAAFARLLADRAHRRGLAIAQKNTTDLLGARTRIGFDFAVVEECAAYQECAAFADAYNGRVFDIEYDSDDFRTACRTHGITLSITLRDREVRPAGEKGYLRRSC